MNEFTFIPLKPGVIVVILFDAAKISMQVFMVTLLR